MTPSTVGNKGVMDCKLGTTKNTDRQLGWSNSEDILNQRCLAHVSVYLNQSFPSTSFLQSRLKLLYLRTDTRMRAGRGCGGRARLRSIFIEGGLSHAEHHGQEAHLAERRRGDRQRAHLHTDGPREDRGSQRQHRSRQKVRRPVQEDKRQDQGADAEGVPVLQGLPRTADARRQLPGQGRRPHGAHDVRGVRMHRPQAVHQGAIT